MLPEGWIEYTGPPSTLEKNENRGGPAPGNPMLATPKPSSNCGGEVIFIRNLSVDAEKNEIGGESAPGNPMLTLPSHSQSKGQHSKSKGTKDMSSHVQKAGKKLTSKQQQLQQAAKNSKKITEFFSKK